MATKKIIAEIPFTYMYPRPEENVAVLLNEEETTTSEDGGLNRGTFDDISFATNTGAEFKIVFDGETYSAASYDVEIDDETYSAVGAPFDGQEIDFTSYPFCIYGENIITQVAGEHEVKIYANARAVQIKVVNAKNSESEIEWRYGAIDGDEFSISESVSLEVGHSAVKTAYSLDVAWDYPEGYSGRIIVSEPGYEVTAYASGITLANNKRLFVNKGVDTASIEIAATGGEK